MIDGMKTNMFFMLGVAVFLGVAARAEDEGKLEVHEWGTFTVISGSNGQPIQWYQPHEALSELPDFVYPRQAKPVGRKGGNSESLNLLGKSGAGSLYLSRGFFVRMETPVIYFYPDKPMTVSAEVRMELGNVTEWFPNFTQLDAGGRMHWAGELVAPSDGAALSRIPRVEGARGAHYAHAREVPDAWIFHAKTPAAPATVKDVLDVMKRPLTGAKPQPQPWEKFIFYRGAGDALPPYRVEALRNGTVRLSHHGDGGEIGAAFVLDVRAGGARWSRFGTLTEMKRNEGLLYVDRSLNAHVAPVAEVREQLGSAMQTALREAGLTVAEAKAMVATWRDVWFAETGTRVLAILPRSWVDAVLPLSITPAPSKLQRIFVARFEVFTPEREQALLSLLSTGGRPDVADAEKFRGLHLGRFANAALVRAQQLGEERIRQRFADFQAAPPPPTTAAR